MRLMISLIMASGLLVACGDKEDADTASEEEQAEDSAEQESEAEELEESE